MDELMDLLVKDESPSQISDGIKDILFAKSAEKIQDIRPQVSASLFDDGIDFDTDSATSEFDSDVDLDGDEIE
jgi:predicted protein tyrosine phosphatase